jgi:hypothetical protein
MPAVGILVIEPMSQMGHLRRSDRAPMTSGFPPQADISGVGRHVSNVPITDILNAGYSITPRPLEGRSPPFGAATAPSTAQIEWRRLGRVTCEL